MVGTVYLEQSSGHKYPLVGDGGLRLSCREHFFFHSLVLGPKKDLAIHMRLGLWGPGRGSVNIIAHIAQDVMHITAGLLPTELDLLSHQPRD